MKMVDLRKISQNFLSPLKEREKEVILRRFGLFGREKETLESIGRDFGVCRERIRQIEKAALEKIKKDKKGKEKIFKVIFAEFKRRGGVRSEEALISEKGREIIFLLNLEEKFKRIKGDEKFSPFWTIGKNYYLKLKRFCANLVKYFRKEKKLLKFDEISKIFKIKREILRSYLEISKLVKANEEGYFGLVSWPEITPKGVKDKAYLVLKKMQRPLHFTEIAAKIKGAKVETVHNELIRDPRFVLVGRGIYALAEWGYWPGELKDIILKILKEKGPMTREEILEEVKKQRIVKPSTVHLYLYNKNYFERDSQGRYRPKIA